MLVSVDKLDKSLERYKSAEGISQKRSLLEIAGREPADSVEGETVSSPILAVEDNLEKRRQMLEATALEPVDFAFERAIGNNDSVYSNFIELIGAAKRKVARIVVKVGSNPTDYATGFMVSDRLLLTNWHVFNAL